jgi:hypothetical protein
VDHVTTAVPVRLFGVEETMTPVGVAQAVVCAADALPKKSKAKQRKMLKIFIDIKFYFD